MGMKAKNLSLLIDGSFNVPAGFTISKSDYESPSINLETWVDSIGGFPVAVRSSGKLEDLDDASFAFAPEVKVLVQSFLTDLPR